MSKNASMIESTRKAGRQLLQNTDIQSFKFFKAVVECGGLSPAAEKMSLDISTISRRLKDLEIRWGMRLCNRGRSGFSLTEEGEAIYEIVNKLLQSLEETEDRIGQVRQRSVSQLRIGAVNHVLTNPDIRFDEIIRRIYSKAPDLNVSYNVMPSTEICRAVLDGRIHFGFTAHDQPHPDLQRETVHTERHKIYCGRGHPLFEQPHSQFYTDSLLERKYVAREHPTLTDIKAEKLGMVCGTVANDIEAITVLIESGLYLGYLPTHHVASLPSERNIHAIPIPQSECDVPLYFYRRKGTRRLNIVRLFLDELKKAKAPIFRS